MFTPGVLLTFVIGMFLFLGNFDTSLVCYCFLKVMLISLSILMGCFNAKERSW